MNALEVIGIIAIAACAATFVYAMTAWGKILWLHYWMKIRCTWVNATLLTPRERLWFAIREHYGVLQSEEIPWRVMRLKVFLFPIRFYRWYFHDRFHTVKFYNAPRRRV